jgi:lysophospholipase L1-like esterase
MNRSSDGASENAHRHRAPQPVRFTRRGRYVLGTALSGVLALVAFLPGRGALYSTGSFGVPTAVVTAPAPIRVVAFGDSVPSGYACDCQPFLPIYADLIHRQTNRATVWTNYAVSGQVSGGVLGQLQTPEVVDAVRRSGIVLIMVGANDFVPPFTQVTANPKATNQFATVGKALRSNMISTIARIHELAPATRVVVLGYWNVLEDGKAAAHDYNPAQRAATLLATDTANEALRGAAASGKALFVPTLELFRGKSKNRDPSTMLAADGDHPNVAGHQAIAAALAAAVPAERKAG